MKLSLVFAFVASCALHLAQAADKDTDTDTDTEIITVAFPDGMLREDLGLTNGKPKTYQGAIIDVVSLVGQHIPVHSSTDEIGSHRNHLCHGLLA